MGKDPGNKENKWVDDERDEEDTTREATDSITKHCLAPCISLSPRPTPTPLPAHQHKNKKHTKTTNKNRCKTKMKNTCTLHEYRFSLGLAFITGIITGAVDAAIDDWSVKAFAWAGILMLYALIVAYEFIIMPTPPKPLLQAFLFVLISPLGLLSAHHWTWYILIVMLGKPIEFKLWLAPNIYVSLNTYNTLMATALAIYLTYLAITNIMSCEKT